MQFFQGYHIPNGAMAVHLVLGTNSRPNGEAFVEFGSEEAADAALAKDRASIGTRYVEVFRSNLEQMHQALSRANKSNNLAPVQMQMGMGAGSGMPYAPYPTFSPMGPPMYGGAMGAPGGMGVVDSVVKMRGLPYKVTRNDILEFFAGLSVPLNGVHLMFNEREQPTGEAYVEFSSPEDRERAMSKVAPIDAGPRPPNAVATSASRRDETAAHRSQALGTAWAALLALPRRSAYAAAPDRVLTVC